MKLGLINSAWLNSRVGTADGIRLASEIGFDTIDVFADPLETGPEERELIRLASEREHIPVCSVVGCALGLADFNRSVRDFHLRRAKAYLHLGRHLHASNFLIVVGEYIWEKQVIPSREQWNWAVENLRSLGEYASSLDLQIAVELEPFRYSLINNVRKMSDFLKDVGHPAVCANIDISHLVLAGDAPERIRELTGRIAHVHISDCDGKVHGDLPPGRGCVPFEAYLRELDAAKFDGCVSVELEYSPEPDRIVDWVREAYRSTDHIMSNLGLRSKC